MKLLDENKFLALLRHQPFTDQITSNDSPGKVVLNLVNYSAERLDDRLAASELPSCLLHGKLASLQRVRPGSDLRELYNCTNI